MFVADAVEQLAADTADPAEEPTIRISPTTIGVNAPRMGDQPSLS